MPLARVYPRKACSICGVNGPIFDRGPIRSKGNQTQTLEYHVQRCHPEHSEDWESLMVRMPSARASKRAMAKLKTATVNEMVDGDDVKGTVETEELDVGSLDALQQSTQLSDLTSGNSSNGEAINTDVCKDNGPETTLNQTSSPDTQKDSPIQDTSLLTTPATVDESPYSSNKQCQTDVTSSTIPSNTPQKITANKSLIPFSSLPTAKPKSKSPQTPSNSSSDTRVAYQQVIECSLCGPLSPIFDRAGQGHLSEPKRSLQLHVARQHPEHAEDWKELQVKKPRVLRPAYRNKVVEQTSASKSVAFSSLRAADGLLDEVVAEKENNDPRLAETVGKFLFESGAPGVSEVWANKQYDVRPPARTQKKVMQSPPNGKYDLLPPVRRKRSLDNDGDVPDLEPPQKIRKKASVKPEVIETPPPQVAPLQLQIPQPDVDDTDALNGRCGEVLRVIAATTFPELAFTKHSHLWPENEQRQYQCRVNRKLIQYLQVKIKMFQRGVEGYGDIDVIKTVLSRVETHHLLGGRQGKVVAGRDFSLLDFCSRLEVSREKGLYLEMDGDDALARSGLLGSKLKGLVNKVFPGAEQVLRLPIESSEGEEDLKKESEVVEYLLAKAGYLREKYLLDHL